MAPLRAMSCLCLIPDTPQHPVVGVPFKLQVLSSTVYNGWSDAQLNVLVGNSVSGTAVGPGSSTGNLRGGTVNITVADNSAIANR